MTVQKYNECLETLELPTIKTKKPKVTISNNNFLNQDAEMLIQEFISTLDSENTIFKQDDDFDCTSLQDMSMEVLGQVEKKTSNIPIDYLPLENQIDNIILNEIHSYLNNFDITNIENNLLQPNIELNIDSDLESDSESESDNTDFGMMNYPKQQTGSGIFTINNRKANSINIIPENYFDDLSSTSSYEEIEQSYQSGGSLNESIHSDNVMRIKNLLSPKKNEEKESNFKTIKLEITAAQSKKLLKGYLE